MIPHEAVGDGAGGFVLRAPQLEVSSETTEQHPHNPVPTVTVQAAAPGMRAGGVMRGSELPSLA